MRRWPRKAALRPAPESGAMQPNVFCANFLQNRAPELASSYSLIVARMHVGAVYNYGRLKLVPVHWK